MQISTRNFPKFGSQISERFVGNTARWLSWLKRLTSNEEIPSSNLGRAFLFLAELFAKTHKSVLIKEILPKDDNGAK